MSYQISPIVCLNCGEIMHKPVELGEHRLRCPKCKSNFVIFPTVSWRFFQEKDKKEEVKK